MCSSDPSGSSIGLLPEAGPPVGWCMAVPPPPKSDFGTGRLPAARKGKARPKETAGKVVEKVSPLWKTRLCEFWQVGKCRKGSLCSFAHGQDDLRPSPDFECTSVCPVFLHTGKCDAKGCRYAHSVQQLRVQPHLLKSKMCSFHMLGRCVVGPACRFAHSEEELQEAQAVAAAVMKRVQGMASENAQELLKTSQPAPRPRPPGALEKFMNPTAPDEPKFVKLEMEVVEMEAQPQEAQQADGDSARPRSEGISLADIPDTPKAEEPLKVVIAAAWEHDLLEEPPEPVSSLKNRVTAPGNPTRPPVQAKRSRARRVMVDTMADLEEFPTEIISAVAAAKENPDGLVQVSDSPGLIDLNSRHRQPVIVLDIEDAQQTLQDLSTVGGAGSRKVETPKEGDHLVQIRRRDKGRLRGKAEHRSKSEHRRSSRAERGSPLRPARPAAQSDTTDASTCCSRREAGDEDVPASWCSRGRGRGHCDSVKEGQVCLLCGAGCSERDGNTPCAACNCGLRVFQHNTFLTVDEEDEDFRELPLRRTKSM